MGRTMVTALICFGLIFSGLTEAQAKKGKAKAKTKEAKVRSAETDARMDEFYRLQNEIAATESVSAASVMDLEDTRSQQLFSVLANNCSFDQITKRLTEDMKYLDDSSPSLEKTYSVISGSRCPVESRVHVRLKSSDKKGKVSSNIVVTRTYSVKPGVDLTSVGSKVVSISDKLEIKVTMNNNLKQARSSVIVAKQDKSVTLKDGTHVKLNSTTTNKVNIPKGDMDLVSKSIYDITYGTTGSSDRVVTEGTLKASVGSGRLVILNSVLKWNGHILTPSDLQKYKINLEKVLDGPLPLD